MDAEELARKVMKAIQDPSVSEAEAERLMAELEATGERDLIMAARRTMGARLGPDDNFLG